jgi:effector-binding domain-containing protein
MRSLTLVFALLAFVLPMSAQEAFPPTAPGTTELKTLPAGVLLKSAGRGNYFDGADNLFGPLFRYISKHKIAMTTPVEARVDEAAMFFWVAESERAKVAGNETGVEVITIPERRVASHGARGGYSRANFEKARTTLLAWLADQPAVEAAGEPYAVYWNAPYVPFFLKRFEVHVPVRPRKP